MKKAKINGFHKTALAALFTVGNSLIRYPWRQGQEELVFSFLLSVVGALIPAFLLYPLFRKLFRSPLCNNNVKKILVAILSFLLAVYALFCLFRSTSDYLTLVTGLILPGSNRWLLAAVFLLCSVWLCNLPERGLDCFSLLGFCAVLVTVIALFLSGTSIFQATNVPFKLPENFSQVSNTLPKLWQESLLPLCVLAAYFALIMPEGGEKSLAVGTLLGCGVLLLCIFQTLLTFGTTFASGLSYPYSFAVRIISVGPYYFRLEGLSYLIDFLGCLLRASVSLACAKRLLGRFLPRISRGFSKVCAVVMFAILIIVG